jgi:hypothetical protein
MDRVVEVGERPLGRHPPMREARAAPMTAGPTSSIIAVAQQARGRAIVQLRVQSLHPRLGDPRRLRPRQHRGDLEGDAKTLLHGGGRLACALGPLMHRPRFVH